MQNFKIIGVDKNTGEDTEITIEALSDANARVKAELKGIIVTAVEENLDQVYFESGSIPSLPKCSICYLAKNEIITRGKSTGKYVCLHCDFKSGLCPECHIPLKFDDSPTCEYCDSTWRSRTSPKVHVLKENLQKMEQKDEIRCPSCKSTHITATKKGFGLGKAAVGSILLGPVGLLGGVFGSNNVKAICIKCGYSWHPGSKF